MGHTLMPLTCCPAEGRKTTWRRRGKSSVSLCAAQKDAVINTRCFQPVSRVLCCWRVWGSLGIAVYDSPCPIWSWQLVNTPSCWSSAQLEPPPGKPRPHQARVASWGHAMDSSPANPGAFFQHRNQKVATWGEKEFKFKLPTRQYRDLPLSH